MGTRGKEEGVWLGREEEGNEVIPLTRHPGTAVCLHLLYAAPVSPTPQDLHPTGGRVSTREVGGCAEQETEA